MRRVGAMLSAAAIVASLGVMAAPGGAATALPQCGGLTTKLVGKTTTAVLSKCTPTAATGGSGSGKFTTSSSTTGSLKITITWATKHGTSVGTVAFKPAPGGAKSLGKCPKGTTTRLMITGTVTGGTAPAVNTIKKNQKISASVCLGAKSDTLEPGTVMKI